MFLFRLPLSKKEKQSIKKRERAIASIYGGQIFAFAASNRVLDIDRDVGVLVILGLAWVASIHMAGPENRALVSALAAVLSVGSFSVAHFFSLERMFLGLLVATVGLFIFATYLSRREFVRRSDR